MKTKCVRAGQLERASDKRENAKPVSAKRAKRGYRVGTQFGWYAKLIVDQVGRAWRTGDLRNVTQVAAVTFTLKRDGSVSHVHITAPSGNATLDFSAQRAIWDASPFPPLPPQYPRSDAEVELRFSLK